MGFSRRHLNMCGGGDGNIPAAISCKGCVCTLAVCNIVMAVMGLAFTEFSANAWMNLCMGSAYGGGVSYLLGDTELPAMTMLHALKKEGHLEVGGFLAEFADMEAMRPPFSAPSKRPVAPSKRRPSPWVGTGKPKFMDHVSKNALLATCANPFPNAPAYKGYTEQWDSGDAMGLFKFIIEAADLVTGGLAAGSITGFRLRGYPSDGTETFKNVQAGLKSVSISVPDGNTFSDHDSDQFTASGDMILNNENSWTELTLTSPFIWDGTSNIEIALFHATDGDGTGQTATSSYSNNGLTTKTWPYSSTSTTRLLYASTSTAVSATTWATIPQPIFNSHQSIDSFIPQIEFVTSGCTSKNLATCTSLSSCAQCLARADCKFKKDMGYCIGQDSARYSSYEDVTECPAPCSSFKKCYECRDDADTTCHWVQSAKAEEKGDFSGSCSESNDAPEYGNATHATNNSCQSPEAMADALETCNTIASIYTTGRIGYAFLLIGCTLQLLGVCSWCGIKKDARSNCPLLCTGCNIHWIACLASPLAS